MSQSASLMYFFVLRNAGIYYGSYHFGSVRDYLLLGILVFLQVHGYKTASLATFL